jgi:hypothetical protein
MNTKSLLQLISALLPAAEEIASIFIHNPNSQHKFSVIVGNVDHIAPVVAALGTVAPVAPAAEAK